MARKIFLSILGNTSYSKTFYYFNNDRSTAIETHFIQEATIRHICKDWTDNDAAIIFTTSQSYENNWLHPAQQKNDKCIEKYDGLSKILLEDYNPIFKIKTEWIPDGANETEIWQIFQIIFDTIQEGDEIYYDITHSFRSLPMLITVLMNYAKALKNITVKSITYGNWEGRDSNNYSPVIDLTALSVLQDWSIACNDFIKFGNANRLVSLTNQTINPILAQSQGRDETAKNLKEITKNLQNFVNDIQTARCSEIYKASNIVNLKEALENLQNNLIHQLNPILKQIKYKIEYFDEKENIKNVINAVDWCIKNGLYQQAYSFLVEGTITFICSNNNIDFLNENYRLLVTSALKISNEKLKEEEWNDSTKKDIELTKKLIEFFNKNQELSKELSSLIEYRNDFMHCGLRKNSRNSQKLIDKINHSFSKLKNLIK